MNFNRFTQKAKLFLAIIMAIFFATQMSLAQEFAPVGATWLVELREPFEVNWRGILSNTSVREIMVREKSCKVIFKSQATIFNEISGEYILCQEGDSVLHYIPELDTFNVVMDFGATVGESWVSFDRANEYVSYGNMFNFRYEVDSISFIDYGGSDSLRVQHLEVYSKRWADQDSEYRKSGSAELIQRIGFRKALLPIHDGDGFTDGILEWDVRCYDDPFVDQIKLTDDENCITSSTYNIKSNQLRIVPNPASRTISILGITKSDINNLHILNEIGQSVLAIQKENEVDISHLEKGMYFIRIETSAFSMTEKLLIIN